MAVYEKSSPTLLSQQPSEAKPKKTNPAEVLKWNIVRNKLEQSLNALRNWRQSWWSENYANLALYIEPRRSTWLTQNSGGMPSPNSMNRGRQINSAIVDPTGTYAVRVCSSGLMSGLASPSRPWFKVLPAIKGIEVDEAGRKWLDDIEDRMYTILAGSNFYESFAQECEDLVVFGTAPCIIYEDERDLLRCYNPVVGEYFLRAGATGRVDGLYRTFVFTVNQIVDFFGVDNCPPDIKKMWQAKGSELEVERIVAHSIEPNFAVGENDAGKVAGNFAWREVYWVYGSASQYPLSMKGFVEQPFTASRWSTQSNDAYGRSVGMDVLPDIIQLQVETMRKAEAIEKMVRPPLVADMQLKNQPSSILPGHVTYVQGLGPGTGMRPIYDVNPDIGAMMNDLKEIQARIQRGFFNDIMMVLSQNPDAKRTAYETAQLIAEKMQVLGPVIENIITQSLKPRLKRIFGIMKRKNMLPPPPDSLKDVPVDVEFISMLALAQKAAATGGLERIAALIGNMVPVYPEAKDKLNVDAYIDKMNELLDNPQSILNGPDQVAKIRQAQAEQMKAMQQEQQVHEGVATAGVAADAGKVLSDTEIGGGQSALAAILGQGAG